MGIKFHRHIHRYINFINRSSPKVKTFYLLIPLYPSSNSHEEELSTYYSNFPNTFKVSVLKYLSTLGDYRVLLHKQSIFSSVFLPRALFRHPKKKVKGCFHQFFPPLKNYIYLKKGFSKICLSTLNTGILAHATSLSMFSLAFLAKANFVFVTFILSQLERK